jgi:hypothetical protein
MMKKNISRRNDKKTNMAAVSAGSRQVSNQYVRQHKIAKSVPKYMGKVLKS